MNYLNKKAIRYDRTAILCVIYIFLVTHDFAVGVNIFDSDYTHLF